MKEKSLFAITCCLTILFFIVSIMVGKVSISFQEMMFSDDEVISNLIYNYRIPKSITAILVGIALPVAGFLMQELFKNPLAEPAVLGVTSMASLGVGIVIFIFSLVGLDLYFNNPWILIIASFLGSLFALVLILSFANKVKSSSSLIIVGFMFSGLAAALLGLMQYFSASEKIKSFMMWGFGSISGLSWNQIGVFALAVFVGLLATSFALKGITGLLLGEKYAQSLGINIKKIRLIILIASALLTASATAFTGPIAFIGLAIPHICRSVLKTGNMKLLLKWIVISGILTMLIFSILIDIFPFGSLPINIITSLVGAPIVISILLNNRFEIK